MNRETILEEIKKILEVLAERRSMGRPSYLTSVRKAVESLITLRLSEYVGYLDQQGLVVFDKKRNTLELTELGDRLLSGSVPLALLEGISLHFASAMSGSEAGQEPEPATPAMYSQPEPPASPLPVAAAAVPRPAAEPAPASAEPPSRLGSPGSRVGLPDEKRRASYPGSSWSSPAAGAPAAADLAPAVEAAPPPQRRAAHPSPPPVAQRNATAASPAPASPGPPPVAVTPPPAAAPPAATPAPAAALPRSAPKAAAASVRRYERKLSLGTGGIGQVFEAMQLTLDRPVAIKEIRHIFSYFPSTRRQEIIDQIREVASQHARLHHPFVVELLELCLDEEFPCLVMEFCPGGSLREKIKEQGRIQPREATQLFVQIAEGLAFAHRQGVLHRNLKPENILFDCFGNAKIVDFGMTRIAEREDQKGQFYMGVGTVAYMSPEQFQDSSNISVQSDLYSLGIILYEMLTGKLPGRRSPMPSEYYDDICRDLDDIFDRMTMDVLRDRYSSVDEILLDVYRSPAILSLLRQRGPLLFTDTDLSSLPELTEASFVPSRTASPPLRSTAAAPVRGAVHRREAAPPFPTPAVHAEEHEPPLETPSEEPPPPRTSTPSPPSERRPRVSGRLGRMADSLFGDD